MGTQIIMPAPCHGLSSHPPPAAAFSALPPTPAPRHSSMSASPRSALRRPSFSHSLSSSADDDDDDDNMTFVSAQSSSLASAQSSRRARSSSVLHLVVDHAGQTSSSASSEASSSSSPSNPSCAPHPARSASAIVSGKGKARAYHVDTPRPSSPAVNPGILFAASHLCDTLPTRMSSLSLVKQLPNDHFQRRQSSLSMSSNWREPVYPDHPPDQARSSDSSLYRMSEPSRSAPSLVSPSHSDLQSTWPLDSDSASSHGKPSHAPLLPPRPHERSQSYTPSMPTTKEIIRLERRFHALLELHDKEVSYLQDLRVLVYVHLDAVNQAPFVITEHKKTIRRNVEQVLELGERMGRRLQLAVGSKLEGWRSDSKTRDEDEVEKVIERVAKAFVSESPIFAVYEEFCAYHTEAADLIRQIQAMPDWALWVEQLRTQQNSQGAADCASSTSGTRHHRISVVDMARASSINSRLTLLETVIKPVQQVMRYPMLLKALHNQMTPHRGPGELHAMDRVDLALAAMKGVAEAVNEAKRARDAEKKTELIASRIELESSYRAACVALLGRIQLVGSLHVLYHGRCLDQSDSFKIKYHGIFLYQTHLVIVKVKRATVYEPRHWFPIRYFELVDVPESSSIMPYSFSLKYHYHTFEFGATCELEKNYWVDQLRSRKAAIDATRDSYMSNGVLLNADSVISSIPLGEPFAAPLASPDPSQEGGPPSPISGTTTVCVEESRPVEGTDESPTTPAGTIALGNMTVPSPPTSRVSQRLSRNVNSLLGRTPAMAQAAIDLKLTEVFSDSILSLRTQAAREAAIEAEETVRRRTVSSSAPKRPPTLQYLSVGKPLDKRFKRMTMVDFGSEMDIFNSNSINSGKPVPPVPHQLLSMRGRMSSEQPYPQLKHWSDIPKVCQSVEEVMMVEYNCEESTEGASVERAASSGSNSSASSAGPITPRAASIPLGVLHLIARNSCVDAAGGGESSTTSAPTSPPATTSSPSPEGFFASVFSKRKGTHLSKSTPPSSIDLSFVPQPQVTFLSESNASTPGTEEAVYDREEVNSSNRESQLSLTQESKSSPSSWLPGLGLARRLSRSARRRRGQSTGSVHHQQQTTTTHISSAFPSFLSRQGSLSSLGRRISARKSLCEVVGEMGSRECAVKVEGRDQNQNQDQRDQRVEFLSSSSSPDDTTTTNASFLKMDSRAHVATNTNTNTDTNGNPTTTSSSSCSSSSVSIPSLDKSYSASTSTSTSSSTCSGSEGLQMSTSQRRRLIVNGGSSGSVRIVDLSRRKSLRTFLRMTQLTQEI